MTSSDLAQGNALQATIDLITKVQAGIATAGSKVFIVIIDADNKQLVSDDELSNAIGDADFATLADGVKTDLSTALATAKTTAQTALTAL